MRIIFYGQLGLPKLLEREADSAEVRVEGLSRKLAEMGHLVTVFGTREYLRSGSYHGVELVRVPSFKPATGGWLYLILSGLKLLKQRSDVVHVHGWRAALVVRFLSWLMPRANFVWTIDSLPQARLDLFVAKTLLKTLTPAFAKATAGKPDPSPSRGRGELKWKITTPSRRLQYQLLSDWGVRAAYIPDGFEASELKPIALKTLTRTLSLKGRGELRKGQYVAVLASSASSVRSVARAYTGVNSRKKVVVLGPFSRGLKPLTPNPSPRKRGEGNVKGKFRSLKFVGDLAGRQRDSLLAQAAVVVLADDSTPSAAVLRAAAAGKPIVAVNEARYQEILGLAVPYVKAGDAAHLRDLLRAVVTSRAEQAAWGAQARARSRHFTLDRVVPEYLAAYAVGERVLVPLDSARAVSFTRAPA